ncbi:MAG: hypothetical protein ACE14V_11525, partial [bacterium]
MDSPPRSLRLYGLILLILFILAGLGWVNYRLAAQNEGGRSFLIYWVSARALIVDGDDPYSEEVAADIQAAIREHSVKPPPFHRFTAPLYALLLFLPFALVEDFALAQALWMLFLELSLGLLILACWRLVKWRANAWNAPIYLLFALTWIHSLFALWEGSDVILVALLLAAFLALF